MSSIKDKIAKDRAKVLHKNGDAPSLINQEPGRDGPKQTSNDDDLKDAKIKAKVHHEGMEMSFWARLGHIWGPSSCYSRRAVPSGKSEF